VRLVIDDHGLCTSYARISCGVREHRIAYSFPEERVVFVNRAKSSHSPGRSPQIFGSQSATNVSLHIAHFGRNLGAAEPTIKRSKWLEAGNEAGHRHVDQSYGRLGTRHEPSCSSCCRGTATPYPAACVRTDYLYMALGCTSRFAQRLLGGVR
jgi:hypothetical protein